jgi:hypothetical protein
MDYFSCLVLRRNAAEREKTRGPHHFLVSSYISEETREKLLYLLLLQMCPYLLPIVSSL